MKLGLLGWLLAGVASAQATGGKIPPPPPQVISLGFATTVPASCAATDPQALLIEPAAAAPGLYLCRSGVYLPMIVAPRFSDGEVPAGVQNGSNRVFTLAHYPLATPVVTLNGLVLRTRNDYNRSGLTLTLVPAQIAPKAGVDIFQVWYRW